MIEGGVQLACLLGDRDRDLRLCWTMIIGSGERDLDRDFGDRERGRYLDV